MEQHVSPGTYIVFLTQSNVMKNQTAFALTPGQEFIYKVICDPAPIPKPTPEVVPAPVTPPPPPPAAKVTYFVTFAKDTGKGYNELIFDNRYATEPAARARIADLMKGGIRKGDIFLEKGTKLSLPPPQPDGFEAALTQKIFAAMNKVRRDLGLAELVWSERLSQFSKGNVLKEIQWRRVQHFNPSAGRAMGARSEITHYLASVNPMEIALRYKLSEPHWQALTEDGITHIGGWWQSGYNTFKTGYEMKESY